jgi:O-antigen/teichoic acid export membrane protein
MKLYARRVSTKAGALADSDTRRAAGMAAAQIASNVAALGFTILFARILGASGYGSLAVLVSAFIILMVPGSALQIAVARELSRALARGDADAGTGVRQWLKRLAVGVVVVAVVAVPLREVIASIVNVEQTWAAAAVPVTAVLWAMLCVERGALQGFGCYRIVAISLVAEATGRLVFALALVGAGLDVTGAFLANGLTLIAVGAVLAVPLGRRLPAPHDGMTVSRLRDLLMQARVPVVALSLLFGLQELHIIVVKHQASDDAAGSYAVAAVAAKSIIWVAIGLGLYLLPEAARRVNAGLDARPILSRSLALIGLCAVPALLIFTFGGEQLLAAAFGDDLTGSADALPWLGAAMALLACTHLSVQYLLALRRRAFVGVLAIAATAEVVVLAGMGADLTKLAMALFFVQLACALVVVTTAYRSTSL